MLNRMYCSGSDPVSGLSSKISEQKVLKMDHVDTPK